MYGLVRQGQTPRRLILTGIRYQRLTWSLVPSPSLQITVEVKNFLLFFSTSSTGW